MGVARRRHRGSPAAVSWPPAESTCSRAGWTMRFGTSGTTAVERWESLGGTITAGPAVSSWAPGRLDVFAKGADNALWHKWCDGGWHDWESLGGVIDNEPAAVSWQRAASTCSRAGWTMRCGTSGSTADGAAGNRSAASLPPDRRRARGRRDASTCSPRAPTTRCGTNGTTVAGAAGSRSAASSTTHPQPYRGAFRASTALSAAWTTPCGTSGGPSVVRPCACT